MSREEDLIRELARTQRHYAELVAIVRRNPTPRIKIALQNHADECGMTEWRAKFTTIEDEGTNGDSHAVL